MPEPDIPRDKHAELGADDDAVQRGTNQQGEPDSHTGDDHSQLPADDPNYQPRDTYEDFYNSYRPHRALNQAAPLRPLPDGVTGLDHFRVRRRDRAGDVIHEYRLVA